MDLKSKTYTIDVKHVTRVEGHGRIIVNTKEGVVKEVKLSITEANRFFENFVKGMQPAEVPWIVSRICGICCVGHQMTATKAVEAALGIQVSPQTVLLRKLLTESQFLQSHVLHVYFLAVPDYLGVKSVLPLAKSHPDVVKRALRLKKLANDYTTVFGGRTLHPMANTLKGFRKLPDLDAVAALRNRLLEAIPDIEETVRVAKTLKIPPYERETEYVSLKHPDEYALYDGDVYSSDTKSSVPVRQIPGSHQRVYRGALDYQMVQVASRLLFRRSSGPREQQLRSAASPGQTDGRGSRVEGALLQSLHEQCGSGGGSRALRVQQRSHAG